MQNDPRHYTLDAIERRTLRDALALRLTVLRRSRAKFKGLDEKSRANITANETEQARVLDLLTLLATD